MSQENTKKAKKADTLDISATTTLTHVVNSFVSEFTPAQQNAVREGVTAIVGAQQKLVESALTIGRTLVRMHGELGPDKFKAFADGVLPKMGISGRSAYRYMANFKLVSGTFGIATTAVLALTDGKGITVTDQKKGAMVLDKAAEKVLAKMPVLSDKATPEQVEKWARSFVIANRAAHKTAAQSPFAVIESRISDLWDSFGNDDKGILARIGKLKDAKERTAAAKSLRETVDAMSEELTEFEANIHAIEPGKASATKAS